MKKITATNKFEKAFVNFLNIFDDWELEWVGDQNLCYDAIGKTPKGNDCVIEMKFRKKHYDTKMLEKAKYESLMAVPDCVKIYFVSDPKGSYWFWLDKLTEMNVINKKCPATSYWGKGRINKEVYLLEESQASIVNYVTEDRPPSVWQSYFDKRETK
jgi:hypothetical protein